MTTLCLDDLNLDLNEIVTKNTEDQPFPYFIFDESERVRLKIDDQFHLPLSALNS